MKVRCLVIDDEPIARKGIARYVAQYDPLELAGVLANCAELEAALKKETIDLLFLDIHMPGMTGIEWLESKADAPRVVFITADEAFALTGYELDVIDYLVKPVSRERFEKCVQKIKTVFSSVADAEKSQLFLKVDGKLERFSMPEIYYLEARENYVLIESAQGRRMVLSTLKSLEQELPPYFFKVHKSYVVNTRVIECVVGNAVKISGRELPVSRQYKNQLLEKINIKR